MSTIETPQEATSDYVDVSVIDVRRILPNDRYTIPRNVVVLQETGGEQRLLGIWVGSGEGEAILILMSGIDVPRPLTFNFAINLLEAAGGQLRSARQSGSAKRFSRRTVQMEPAAPLRPMATMPAFLTHLGVAA